MFKNISWSRGFLRLWVFYAVIAGLITLGFILGDNVDPISAFFAGLAFIIVPLILGLCIKWILIGFKNEGE